jgi:hypothetical protein
LGVAGQCAWNFEDAIYHLCARGIVRLNAGAEKATAAQMNLLYCQPSLF